MPVKNRSLFWLILLLMIPVALLSLGGGLFDQQRPWMLQWQHQIFRWVCHQIPERSFWISGQPMAVCSRCFGIYTGFILGWIGMALISRFKTFTKAFRKPLLVGMVFISLADVAGNMLGLWQNTLISRLVLGWLLGFSVAIFFTTAFFNHNIKQRGTYHGAIRTHGI